MVTRDKPHELNQAEIRKRGMNERRTNMYDCKLTHRQ